MQSIPKDKILEHLPDTLTSIRQEYNLDNPGRMEDAIRILREWIEKQPHFKKKDFRDQYLETTIIACKGSLERAKTQLDRLCTLRTLLPQFFGPHNPKKEFAALFQAITPVLLPKLTPDHYRVFLVKANNQVQKLNDFMDYFLYGIILAEYIKTHDYVRGFIIITDFTEVNIMDILSRINPVQLRQAFTILIEGFGMRLKGMHVFTSSKLVDSLITIMKQVVSAKISDRIYSHKSLDDLPDIIPLDLLPKDYGGQQRSLQEISNEWVDIVSSEEHISYLREMEQAGSDEACRPADKFNEDYAGMPGTFRVLNVD